MENFLSNFTNTNTEITSTNPKLQASAEFHGTIDICKGLLNMTICFYSRLFNYKYENYIGIDDWETTEIIDIKFNGIIIDDIDKLKNSMISSGLSTLAESLTITNSEIKTEIANQIEQSSIFKAVYGKKAIMFDNLSENEQKNIRLKFVIDNYENKSLIKHDLSLFLVENEEGVKVNPSYEELVKMYTIN